MTSEDGFKKQLPVVLPPVPDELLSSWIARHAAYYNVSPRAMLRHAIPDASSIQMADGYLTDEEAKLLAHIFRREPSEVRRMTFANLQNSARCLIAVGAIHTCQGCAARQPEFGIVLPVLRSWRLAWRITCPVCGSHLRAIGQGSGAGSADDTAPVASWEHALRGERLLDDFAERGAKTWASTIDLLKLLLIRRNAKPIDPEHWIETHKVVDLVVPGFDRLVAAMGTKVPGAARPVWPLALRRALVAGVAILERSGPALLRELHRRTIGAYHAQFRDIAARILAPDQPAN